ncbi:Major Facilitator Superfamily (MFS), partial [Pseudoloma neurophilia]
EQSDNQIYTLRDRNNSRSSENNVLNIFKRPSMIFLYLIVVVSGIFKCVMGNFALTFYEITGNTESFSKILLILRYSTEVIVLIFLSYVPVAHFTSMSLSLVLCGVSLFFDLKFTSFNNIVVTSNSYILVLSEILAGIGRAGFMFSSILIFKEYDTPKTVTQVQGIRNGAYNGIACVLIGLCAYVFIPKDLVDYRSLPKEEASDMKQKQILFFREMFSGLMYLLFSTIALSLLARYLFNKNR